MNNLNSVLIEGSLVQPPELAYTPKETPVCTLVIASRRTYKLDGARVIEDDHFTVRTVDKLAEVCAKHLDRGRGVRVVGRLRQERFAEAGAPDGAQSKPPVVVILAEHVEFKPVRKPVASTEAKAS